jgi:hypothetical protein
MPWLRRLVAAVSLRRPGSVSVGFVMDKVALGQVFLRGLQFSPVTVIPLAVNNHIIWGMNNRPIGACSSET